MLKNKKYKARNILLALLLLAAFAVLLIWNLDYTSNKVRVATDRYKYTHTGPAQVVQGKIDINIASEQTLVMLDAIGEKTAAAIVEYRSINGSFSDIYEIMNVKGIGEDTFEKIKDYICVK